MTSRCAYFRYRSSDVVVCVVSVRLAQLVSSVPLCLLCICSFSCPVLSCTRLARFVVCNTLNPDPLATAPFCDIHFSTGTSRLRRSNPCRFMMYTLPHIDTVPAHCSRSRISRPVPLCTPLTVLHYRPLLLQQRLHKLRVLFALHLPFVQDRGTGHSLGRVSLETRV